MIQKNPGPRKPTNRPSRRTIARSHCWATLGASDAIKPITTPGIIAMGLFHTMPAPNPTPKQTRNKMRRDDVEAGLCRLHPLGRPLLDGDLHRLGCGLHFTHWISPVFFALIEC